MGRLESSEKTWNESFKLEASHVRENQKSSTLENMIDVTKDVHKETVSLHRKFRRLVMDSRTCRGETIRNCCEQVQIMYKRIENSENCSEILCRLGNFIVRHMTQTLAEEIWPDIMTEENKTKHKTAISYLESLMESAMFQNFPRRVVVQSLSGSNTPSSSSSQSKLAWMRTLPLEHFGFFAESKSLHSRRRAESNAQGEYAPFFPCATNMLEMIAESPFSPSIVAKRLFRAIKILFLEIRSLFGASTSQTLDSAEILLPGLIVVVVHSGKLDRIRDLLVFASTRFVKEQADRSRHRHSSDGETEYYITSILAALSWVDEQEDPSSKNRFTSQDLSNDYEALLAVFDEAAEISPVVFVKKSPLDNDDNDEIIGI